MKKLLFLTITIGLFYGVSCFASGGYRYSNSALKFDGNKDYVSISGGVLSPTMTVSVMTSVVNDNNTSAEYWMDNTDTDSKNRFYLSKDGSKYYSGWRYDDAGTNKLLNPIRTSTNKLGNNIWNRITTVIDSVGGTHNYYINNYLVTQTSSTYTVGTIETPIYIGVNSNQALNGKIDNLRIWSRVLTEAEILKLYYQNIVPRTNLVAEYKFNEGKGTTAYDTSGNGNNGTISGATWTFDTPTKSLKSKVLNRY